MIIVACSLQTLASLEDVDIDDLTTDYDYCAGA